LYGVLRFRAKGYTFEKEALFWLNSGIRFRTEFREIKQQEIRPEQNKILNAGI
jgi:hypothetical protein